MKKLLQIFVMVSLIAFLTMPALAETRHWKGYLGATNSGNTTTQNDGDTSAEGGVSVFILSGHGLLRSTGATVLADVEEYKYWTVQVKDVRTSQAAEGAGDYSGVTFTVLSWVSDNDGVTWWAKAAPQWLSSISGVALSSGVSNQRVTYLKPKSRYVKFGFYGESGVTQFDYAEISIEATK